MVAMAMTPTPKITVIVNGSLNTGKVNAGTRITSPKVIFTRPKGIATRYPTRAPNKMGSIPKKPLFCRYTENKMAATIVIMATIHQEPMPAGSFK